MASPLRRSCNCASKILPNDAATANPYPVIAQCQPKVNALSLQGKSHEGHQLLMAAITACPSYAEAYNNLGVLQRDVGAVKVIIYQANASLTDSNLYKNPTLRRPVEYLQGTCSNLCC